MRTGHSLAADLTRNRWTAPSARRVLAAWKASGMSMAAFARRQGVGVQRVSWWRKRLGGEAARDPVASLAFIPAAVSGAGGVTVRLPGGIAVEAADAETLPASWVAALARELSERS